MSLIDCSELRFCLEPPNSYARSVQNLAPITRRIPIHELRDGGGEKWDGRKQQPG